MEQSFNIINFEYVETNKGSIFTKIIVVILILIILVAPLNEILKYNQVLWQGMCCLCP